MTTTWNWLWEKHDQVKDLFRFFVNPGETIGKKKGRKSEATAGGYGGNDDKESGGKRPYTRAQLTGLILGPLLFLITILFVSPEGLSSGGVGILASTIWIAVW